MTRVFESLCGQVRIQRPRYRCRRCQASFYAPQRFLDTLGGRRVGPKLLELATQLALYVPYSQASHLLGECLGVSVTGTTLRRDLVQRGEEESWRQGEQAHDCASFRYEAAPGAPSTARNRQYVEMDGCFVHQWHKKSGFELKVGEMFSDPILTESKKRHWISRKQYVAHSGSAEAFGERLYAATQPWGLDDAEELYVLGDGASWIKSLWSQYYPHAEFIVDWWHVQNAVWRAVRSLIRDENSRKQWGRRITALLFDGQCQAALSAVERLPASTPQQIETRQNLSHYLDQNREGLHNYRAVQAQGIQIGSGVIEDACMDVVGRRFKHRGMSWSPRGAEALLCLRTLHLNGQWHHYRHPDALQPAV
ncbi:MAG TPA: ISKra4 family transposase [Armatimonadota bacterium]|nr:ISKra4 family transposase [Armatimonadota bacterium]HQK92060.1 ISKra4 family transposase [Armatimonadota bacterium]